MTVFYLIVGAYAVAATVAVFLECTTEAERSSRDVW